LLATRGKPKRLHADVRQGIIAPRREHSRKPDEVHARIERLVAGPYLELFALQRRPGWKCWGDQLDKFEVAQ
jgi:N6-adenosine-specific RNA methylase IME4